MYFPIGHTLDLKAALEGPLGSVLSARKLWRAWHYIQRYGLPANIAFGRRIESILRA